MIETALYVQLGVFLAIATAFRFSTSASLFHPLTFYLLFHFICFVLRPFMIYYLGFNHEWLYMGFSPSPNQFTFTLFVTSIALFVFTVVSWTIGSAEPNFSIKELEQFTESESIGLIWTWLLLGPVALYSAIYAVQPIGLDETGTIEMTQDLVTGRTIFVNTTGYLVDAQTMLGPLAVMVMWRFRFALWTWGLQIAFIAYRAILGSRWLIVAMVFTLILIHLFRKRKKWFQIRYVAVLFPLFVLFQSIGADRNYLRDAVNGTDRASYNFEYPEEKTWLQKQDGPDFANFDFLAFILWVVPDRSHTYTYFTQYLQIFTEPIPRILWPNKPIGEPIKLVVFNNFGNFIGLTDSIVGDGWKSAGWLGIVITMSIVGFILGFMHRRFWHHLDSPSRVIFYCTFLPLTITWFRDGGIYIAKYTLFTILPILVWRGFTRVVEDLKRQREKPALRKPVSNQTHRRH